MHSANQYLQNFLASEAGVPSSSLAVPREPGTAVQGYIDTAKSVLPLTVNVTGVRAYGLDAITEAVNAVESVGSVQHVLVSPADLEAVFGVSREDHDRAVRAVIGNAPVPLECGIIAYPDEEETLCGYRITGDDDLISEQGMAAPSSLPEIITEWKGVLILVPAGVYNRSVSNFG